MRRRKKDATSRGQEPERAIEDEPAFFVGAGVPGMKAAMGFAGDVFSMWMVGWMTMPMELPPAIGYGAIQAISSGGSGRAGRPK